MEALLVLITVLVPIIMGLEKIVNKSIPEKFHSIVPIILGLVLAPLGSGVFATGLALNQLLWSGLLAGMAAGGSYNPADLKNRLK
jgi:hypothetical protein